MLVSADQLLEQGAGSGAGHGGLAKLRGDVLVRGDLVRVVDPELGGDVLDEGDAVVVELVEPEPVQRYERQGLRRGQDSDLQVGKLREGVDPVELGDHRLASHDRVQERGFGHEHGDVRAAVQDLLAAESFLNSGVLIAVDRVQLRLGREDRAGVVGGLEHAGDEDRLVIEDGAGAGLEVGEAAAEHVGVVGPPAALAGLSRKGEEGLAVGLVGYAVQSEHVADDIYIWPLPVISLHACDRGRVQI